MEKLSLMSFLSMLMGDLYKKKADNFASPRKELHHCKIWSKWMLLLLYLLNVKNHIMASHNWKHQWLSYCMTGTGNTMVEQMKDQHEKHISSDNVEGLKVV